MNIKSRESKIKFERLLAMLLLVALLLPLQMKSNKLVSAAENVSKVTIANFEGVWYAAGYALGGQCYTGCYGMDVKPDGSFYIYDWQAANPEMEGKMTVLDEDRIQLECVLPDFDPAWPNLNLTDQLEYHFYNDYQVRITYGGLSILFIKEENKLDFRDFFTGQWDHDHHQLWYTNNGINVSATYMLKLIDDTMVLYQVDRGGETVLANFCVLDYNDKTNVIRTITELSDTSKLPKNWRMMKAGRQFQNFKLYYNSKKHCLTLIYKNKSYSFYSNITYGIDNNSDYSKVMDKDWKCKINGKEIRFSTEYRENEYSFIILEYPKCKTIANGTIKINEKKKKVTLKWNSFNTDWNFLSKYYNQKSLTYSLKGKDQIVINYAGKRYTFKCLR